MKRQWYLEFVDQGEEDPPPRVPDSDSEVMTEGDLPDMLVAPAFPFDGDGFTRIELQVCRRNGQVLAVAFTSRQALVSCMGSCQPWVAASGRKLLRLVNQHRIGALLIDPAPGVVSPLWSDDALRTLNEANDVRI